MAKIQVYASDEVTEKIKSIVERRKTEGAKEKDVSFSSVSSMLLELGLRVYKQNTGYIVTKPSCCGKS